MNQQLATSDTQEHGMASVSSAFDRMMAEGSTGMNSGAVAIESQRAIAEARGQMQLARMFPRSVTEAIKEFLESCKSPEFAAEAFYTVKNRGSGPSIRFAEEAARCYGHFDYGHRELSRSEGKSEIEVFAWDKQKNNTSKRQITVLHVLDVGGGSRKLTQQADIDNKIANVASKQMRGRILALLPKHMIAAGKAECLRTIAGGNEKPMGERILGCVHRFDRRGVTSDQLAKYLRISNVDDMTAEQLGDLQGVFNAIKEGAKIEDYFGADADASDESSHDTGSAIAKLQADSTAGSKNSTQGTSNEGQVGGGSQSSSSPRSSSRKASASSPKRSDSESATMGEPPAAERHEGDQNRQDDNKAQASPGGAKVVREDDVF